MVGEKGDYLKKIKSKLPKNINFKYIKKKNSPTILKRRFLDHVSKNKVLGVYKINDEILTKKQDRLFCNILKNILPKYDLVIVSDYGHGFISNKAASLICKYSKYLALNAQINAANIGYHSMRNYKNVDCVIINENEIRHELRDKNSNIKFLMKKLSKTQNINNLVVTRGSLGAVLYDNNKNKFTNCGALANVAIDKIGAGDAMLSVIAFFFKCGFSNELSLLGGSLAAAQSAETIGNKKSVSKTKILKTLYHLLK
jgi:bifunctional ADP-heptose synthase (sugar kinase/adenylyltransferase)